MPLTYMCAQLTRDLFVIVKFIVTTHAGTATRLLNQTW